jgi:hypothetical protein
MVRPVRVFGIHRMATPHIPPLLLSAVQHDPSDSTESDVLSMFPSIMAAANASARGQRAAILDSPPSELTGFNLMVDYLSPGCARERTFAVADLATFYGGSRTVGDMLRRMRCSGACGGRVGAAWLVTVERSHQTAPYGVVGAGSAGVSVHYRRSGAAGSVADPGP